MILENINTSSSAGGTGGYIEYNGLLYAVNRSAPANIAASTTDGNIVTAVASKSIVVIAWNAVTGATATNLTFNSKPAGAGTAISQIYPNGSNGGEVLGEFRHGYFATNSGEGLTVTTGTGSTTGIMVYYILV